MTGWDYEGRAHHLIMARVEMNHLSEEARFLRNVIGSDRADRILIINYRPPEVSLSRSLQRLRRGDIRR